MGRTFKGFPDRRLLHQKLGDANRHVSTECNLGNVIDNHHLSTFERGSVRHVRRQHFDQQEVRETASDKNSGTDIQERTCERVRIAFTEDRPQPSYKVQAHPPRGQGCG